jgi:hypothetical protein
MNRSDIAALARLPFDPRAIRAWLKALRAPSLAIAGFSCFLGVALVPIVQVLVRMEMILAGKVEAACLSEPLATLAVQRGPRPGGLRRAGGSPRG